MMGIFYKAERKAFLPHIVRKSFYDVGLWPYDPEKIIRICQEHTSVDSQDKENESLRDLIDAIKIQRQRKAEWCEKILTDLEPANITEDENYHFQFFGDDDEGKDPTDDEDENGSPLQENSDSMPVEPPAKRVRTPSGERKICCARGCQKSHIRSKNGLCAPSAKKTSALLMLKTFNIINANILLIIIFAKNRIQLRKNKKHQK